VNRRGGEGKDQPNWSTHILEAFVGEGQHQAHIWPPDDMGMANWWTVWAEQHQQHISP
jgi:hypothetical protein